MLSLGFLLLQLTTPSLDALLADPAVSRAIDSIKKHEDDTIA